MMQKTIYFLLITFWLTTNSNAQAFQQSDFTDKIITAFLTKDFNAYRQLLIDTADFKEITNDFIENSHIKAKQKKELLRKEKDFSDSSDIWIKKDFDKLINEGEKIGVNWNLIEKTKSDFKEEKVIVNSTKESLVGYLNFKCQNNTYTITGIEVIKLSSGYKIFNIAEVKKVKMDSN